MSERRQLNVRLDNEPKLYEAIRDQAHRMNVSISAFIVMALKSALDWQIPFDAPALLRRTQALEKAVRDLALWKEGAELRMEKINNAHAIELDNLKKRLAMLEHACELEQIKNVPATSERLAILEQAYAYELERIKNDPVAGERLITDFLETHKDKLTNDPTLANRVVNEFLEKQRDRGESKT